MLLLLFTSILLLVQQNQLSYQHYWLLNEQSIQMEKKKCLRYSFGAEVYNMKTFRPFCHNVVHKNGKITNSF